MSASVVITGAGGGIGRAVTKRLAGAGLRVVGIDVAPAPPGWDGGEYVVADLADPVGADAAWAEAAQHAGGVDHLVNSIGVYDCAGLDDFAWADYERVLAVNLHAPVRTAMHWVHGEPAPGGRLVNVSSVAGVNGSRDLPYSVSKSGLLGLTRSLARSLAGRGLSAFSVSPGVVDTPMSARMPEERRDGHLTTTLHGRSAEPDEVASLIEFLVIGAPEYMSGSNLVVGSGATWT